MLFTANLSNEVQNISPLDLKWNIEICNPGRRIYRQPPLLLHKVDLKWTTCLEQKHNFVTGVIPRKYH